MPRSSISVASRLSFLAYLRGQRASPKHADGSRRLTCALCWLRVLTRARRDAVRVCDAERLYARVARRSSVHIWNVGMESNRRDSTWRRVRRGMGNRSRLVESWTACRRAFLKEFAEDHRCVENLQATTSMLCSWAPAMACLHTSSTHTLPAPPRASQYNWFTNVLGGVHPACARTCTRQQRDVGVGAASLHTYYTISGSYRTTAIFTTLPLHLVHGGRT